MSPGSAQGLLCVQGVCYPHHWSCALLVRTGVSIAAPRLVCETKQELFVTPTLRQQKHRGKVLFLVLEATVNTSMNTTDQALYDGV